MKRRQCRPWMGAYQLAAALCLPLWLAGCGSTSLGAGVLGSMAAAAGGESAAAIAQERVQTQQLAQETAVPEKFQQLETEPAYLAVIAQLQRQGLWYAALAHLDALEARWKPSDDSRLLRADALRQVDMSVESAQLYQSLLQGSKAAQAQHGLGLLAAAQGQYSVAVAHLQAARRLAPTDALLLNDLGYALLHTPQGRAARLPLMQAAQLQPAQRRIQSNVAVFLLLHGQESEAQAWMQQHQMDAAVRAQVQADVQRLTAWLQAPGAADPAERSAPAAEPAKLAAALPSLNPLGAAP